MSKLDPKLERLLQEQSRSRSIAPEASDAQAAESVSTRVNVLLKYTGDLASIEALGFQPITVAGDIAGGSIPLDQLAAITALPNVVKIEIERPLYRDVDISVPEIKAIDVHAGTPSYRGTGVIIGIIDSGVDYRHQAFRNADGSSRILAIWDQFLDPATGESPPAGQTLGVEYTKQQLDAALQTEHPENTIHHKDADENDGHGTHVAGIAAGDQTVTSGNPPKYLGVAPEADLIVVRCVTAHEYGESVTVLAAVNYIFTKAADPTINKPVVINLSQGDNLGPHDGTNLLEQGIDNLLTTPGRAMIKSAGNEGDRKRHAMGTVAQGGSQTVEFEVPARHSRNAVFDLWYDGGDRFAWSITPPGGDPSTTVNPGNAPTLNLPNGNVVEVNSQLNDPDNHDNRIYWEIKPGSAGSVQSGTWTFTLTGTTAPNGGFHCWIERGDLTAQFTGTHQKDSHTLSIPGTSQKVIAVASYITRGGDSGKLSDFSSHGPTRDGRHKPEIAAPGEGIVSARSGWMGSDCSICCTGPYHTLQGTSMAAPHVTGVVALMLQKNHTLTQDQIRTHLQNSARFDTNTNTPTAVPNDLWGHGKINALAAVQAVTPAPRSIPSVRRSESAPPVNVPPTPAPGGAGLAFPWPTERLRLAQRELQQTPVGNMFTGLIRAHRSEIRALINENRRVATVWQRNGGPALLRQSLLALYTPDQPLPTTIDNQPVAERVRRVLAILRRYGSPALAADIDAYGPMLLEWNGLSYNQLLARLRGP